MSASRLGNNSATHPTSHGFTAINSPTREPEDPTPATKRKKPNNPQNKSANARANSTGRKKKVEERQQGDDLVTSTIVMPSKIDGLVPLKPCDSTIKKPAAFRYQPHQTSDTLVTTFQKAVAIKEPVLSNLEQENRSVYPDNQTEFAIDNAEETELHHHLNDTNNLSVLPDPNQLYERSGLEREDGQLSLSAAHDEGLFDSDLAAHQLEGQVDQAKNLSSFNDYDNEAEDMFDDVDFDEWIEHEKLHTQVVAESTEEEMTMPSNDHASVQETNDPNQIHQNLEEEEDFLDDDDDDEIQELLRLASEASTFSSPTKS